MYDEEEENEEKGVKFVVKVKITKFRFFLLLCASLLYFLFIFIQRVFGSLNFYDSIIKYEQHDLDYFVE